MTDALRNYVELARSHGFVPIVTLSPTDRSVYAEWIVFEAPEAARLAETVHDKYVEYLQRMSTELNFPFLDLTPALQTAARSRGADDVLYRPDNWHFTESGYQVAAQAIASLVSTLEGNREPDRRTEEAGSQ